MKKYLIIVLFAAFNFCIVNAQSIGPETFKPLRGSVPSSVKQLWKGYNPRKEPLDVEVLKIWEDQGVVFRLIRYRVGIFKGKKAMMAAVYGFPRGRNKLPGLVYVHGGGQYADYHQVLENAKNGYATIAIAWAGRLSVFDDVIGPKEVQLFWGNKKSDPLYRITTDWGSIDAYHAPNRSKDNMYAGTIQPNEWTLDAVESPRNSGWFFSVLAARRALTFLEHQPEVNSSVLGIYGHSMGGKITVMTAAIDKRIKAAVPSCGGLSNNVQNILYQNTLGDNSYLKMITCPIFFLSPSNDFHGRIDDLQHAICLIKTNDWRIACSPHFNHQDQPEYAVSSTLWFNQYLKHTFSFPKIPLLSVQLSHYKMPRCCIVVDAAKEVLDVEVYYTDQGADNNSMDNAINKFWFHAKAIQIGGKWYADLPLYSIRKTLWVYANVTYKMGKEVSLANYYHEICSSDKFCLSSKMETLHSADLQKFNIPENPVPCAMIDNFDTNDREDWFVHKGKETMSTHKLYHDKWKAPTTEALLSIDLKSEENRTIKFEVDDSFTSVNIPGDNMWHQVILKPSMFKSSSNVKSPLENFSSIKEFTIANSTNNTSISSLQMRQFKWIQ